ncbi:MAG: hypothetical protein ACOYS2_03220 [Patescibacteria group bacterium]
MDKQKKTILILVGLVILGIFLGAFLWKKKLSENRRFISEEKSQEEERIEIKHYPKPEKEPLPPPSMDILKKKGCVADGLFFGYKGKDNTALKMINRSECQYIHRAVETWLDPPDFEKVAERKKQIIKKDMVYGMFIAEAIDKKANYNYPAENREFEFDKMCRSGSDNFWGEHTCKPYFGKAEYRKYLRYITEQAIDNGIQVFMFGQVFYQENSNLDEPYAKDIIQEMREYAAWKGTSILVGAQTNSIENEKYLRLFDFIEGGVGLGDDGTVESGPCFSRWWNETDGGWCWALLWHDKYAKKANNVLVHLDWSGVWGDDMSTFTRMDKQLRAKTLKYLYNHFRSQNVGFLMPMLTTVFKNNGGCYGDKARYYSADRNFSCQDEETINSILKNP